MLAQANALAAYHSQRDLPAWLFAGISPDPEREAFRQNRKRREERAKAKAQRGLPGVLGR